MTAARASGGKLARQVGQTALNVSTENPLAIRSSFDMAFLKGRTATGQARRWSFSGPTRVGRGRRKRHRWSMSQPACATVKQPFVVSVPAEQSLIAFAGVVNQHGQVGQGNQPFFCSRG